MAAADGDGSPGAAARRLLLRADRLLELEPPMRVVAAECETMTMDAFRNETSPAGEEWPRLALRTLQARAGKLPGAKQRDRDFGDLSDKARRRRADAVNAALTGGGRDIKKLLDTGRLRASIQFKATRDGFEISGAAYLRAHVDGTDVIPKRNPLPIEKVGENEYRLIPKAREFMHRAIVAYVETGRVPV